MQKMNLNQQTDPDKKPMEKLLVSGFVQLAQEVEPAQVQRGMLARAQNGLDVGSVAAVILDYQRQKITHLLLGQVPPTAVYHRIPLAMIDRIENGTLWLRAAPDEIRQLPVYQPEN